ncbi:MAG: class I SAM-dependent methyltransferase [Candidatus Aminicenantes bacterium]|nr:MAG: class I SAM-dependent methyltransferase [Candidatus Aminicenantes bacterium]
MRRIIEKLVQQRKEKEEDFSKKLEEIKEKSKEFHDIKGSLRFQQLFSSLEEILEPKGKKPVEKRGRLLPPFSKASKKGSFQELFNQQVFLILFEFKNALEQNLSQTKELISSFTDIIQLNAALTDAKDKEWDALGNNHVGMIFKSMEWRVDKLAAAYEDANLLMKKFLLLKENLNQLLSVLQEKRMPSPPQVKEILQPLEDWRYAGFENRYRGSEQEIKKQQASYVSYFKKGGKVLDLGCGRGEFIEILEENGIEAEGIDINGQMIEICRDKGLNCQKADILKKLAEYEDGTLGGIFSSQVIEHLSPSYLRRMIELAYFKLSPASHIVLETINSASVFSLVQIYFLDLSHQKPVHPQTLKFLLESTGFEKVEIKYSFPLEKEKLQDLPGSDEFTSILNQNIDNLNKLLYAPPNYAAIGLKK